MELFVRNVSSAGSDQAQHTQSRHGIHTGLIEQMLDKAFTNQQGRSTNAIYNCQGRVGLIGTANNQNVLGYTVCSEQRHSE